MFELFYRRSLKPNRHTVLVGKIVSACTPGEWPPVRDVTKLDRRAVYRSTGGQLVRIWFVQSTAFRRRGKQPAAEGEGR